MDINTATELNIDTVLYDLNASGAITMNGTTIDIDGSGAMQINSSGGAISIGNDDIDQTINIVIHLFYILYEIIKYHINVYYLLYLYN